MEGYPQARDDRQQARDDRQQAQHRLGQAGRGLVLTAHEVYLPKPKLAVEGSGGVQASFDFRGAKKNTGAGRMLTVTLTNDLDGLVYG